ncbi:MAG TPA: hypothetical protein VN698_15065 [Bacteroidia bacterium]|nr:hypothetical protein [Bacteroidia bacterium]
MDQDQLLKLFCNFCTSINIEVVEKEFDETSFLPGIKIENGKLVVDLKKLAYPGDLLHEAGHIAVTSSIERGALNDNVTDNKPGKEGEELAAMLWSYAACLQLKINPEIVFHKDGYKGDSEWILNNYKNKTFIGLPLLTWMGMATAQNDANGFPHMIKWLRD